MTVVSQSGKPFRVRRDPPVLSVWDDGSVRVAGTRVLLETVVTAHEMRHSPVDIARQYGELDVGTVHAVIAYYLAHAAEVDAYLELRRQAGEMNRQEALVRWPVEGLKARLSERPKAAGAQRSR
jgi:uncharacterized protein (DUF433 family)